MTTIIDVEKISGVSRSTISRFLNGKKVRPENREKIEKAIQELYKKEFLIRLKKTGEWHVSLNPKKRQEIYRFLGLPPK